MLNVFAEIRPGERRAAYSAFFTLFGAMIGHALLETARDGLFLSSIPPTRLPYVYLAVAVVAMLIYALQQRRGPAEANNRQLAYWFLGSAAVTFLFWVRMDGAPPWVYYALYTWLGVFSTLVLVRFWILVGDLFTVTQAKRLFAPIGVGGVLGAIVGSGLARVLAAAFEPDSLLLASAAAMVGTAALPAFLWPRLPDSPTPGRELPPSRDLWLPFRTILERPYLRRVAELLLLATITLTLVDFLFKFYVAGAVPAADLTGFLAAAYLAFNVLSLLAQLVLVSWLVRALGMSRVLSILPALLVAGGLAVVTLGGLIPVLLLKAVDGSLRHSLHRTTSEVLYVPLTGELRARVKGFMDVLTLRGGQALTSLLILLLVLMGPTVLLVGLLVVLTGGLWIWTARRLKEHYLELFRETLNEVSVQTRFDFPELDLASLEVLISALNSPRDTEVLATLDLLAEQDRVQLIPALVLYHPSPAVVIRALELFTTSGREDFLPITDRLLEHHDPEVRAAVLRSRAWTAPDPALYEQFSTDPSPIVRATALIGMVSYGSTEAGEARQRIEEMARFGLIEEKLAVARAIRYSPGAAYEDVLLTLSRTPNSRVRRAVIAAMREILSYAFIPRLMDMLPSRDLRTEARAVLVEMGSPVLETLDEALGDPGLDVAVRRQLPRLISQFEAEPAAGVLMRHLGEEPDGSIRYRILRALGRLTALDPGLSLDRERIEDVLRRTLEAVFRIMDWKLQLVNGARERPERKTPVHDLMVALLDHKEFLAQERLFRLLGLLHPRDDLRSLYRGIRSTRREVHASSEELLEDLLEPPYREAILALADDVPDAEKLQRAGPFYRPASFDYETLLRRLLEAGGVGMRCMVAYHVGELRLVNLDKDLEKVPRDEDGLIERTVSRAMALLNQAAAG